MCCRHQSLTLRWRTGMWHQEVLQRVACRAYWTAHQQPQHPEVAADSQKARLQQRPGVQRASVEEAELSDRLLGAGLAEEVCSSSLRCKGRLCLAFCFFLCQMHCAGFQLGIELPVVCGMCCPLLISAPSLMSRKQQPLINKQGAAACGSPCASVVVARGQ